MVAGEVVAMGDAGVSGAALEELTQLVELAREVLQRYLVHHGD